MLLRVEAVFEERKILNQNGHHQKQGFFIVETWFVVALKFLSSSDICF